MGGVQAQGTPQDNPQTDGGRGRAHTAPVGRGRAPVGHRGVLEARREDRRRFDILRTIRSGPSNARLEAVNNKIKTTIRIGYGYRNLDNFIALVMPECGGLNLKLPGRQ